ncbi:hypothetical protein [Croceicoccus bisphenolivorans]|uniref:hypothetical protein n=1 Tax=Croceicoccus bisphenolivorans TaxID=1783232 RepID=UPI000831D94A|nr:hypothetical protein [Croceicoccus bisphenolivorans]
MSGVDILARGLAARADLGNAAPLSAMRQRALPANLGQFETSGYQAPGKGAARYVCDALCNAAMADAHPLACHVNADGRVFRLAPTNGVLEPEMFGAPGGRGANSQPAIQAMFQYGAAVGLTRYAFAQREYELWATERATAANQGAARDGHPIAITATASLFSLTGRTALYFVGQDGANGNDTWQLVDTSPSDPTPKVWRGGGIKLFGDAGHGARPEGGWQIETFHMKGMDLIGDRVRDTEEGPVWKAIDIDTGKGWDTSDKGLAIQDSRAGTIWLEDCTITGFKGESYYIGGTGPDEQKLVGCHLSGSNGSCFNPGGRYGWSFIDGSIGDSWQAIEGFGGEQAPGTLVADTEIYDCSQLGLQGYSGGAAIFFGNPYSVLKRWRDPDAAIPWLTFRNVRITSVPSVILGGGQIRGDLELIDSGLILQGNDPQYGGMADIDLRIEYVVDRVVAEPPLLIGVDSLTKQITGGDTDEFVPPASNINVTVRCTRTELARLQGRSAPAVLRWRGYFDAPSCTIWWSGNGASTGVICQDGTPKSFPLIAQAGIFATPNFGGRSYGGTTQHLHGGGKLSPVSDRISLNNNQEGSFDVTLDAWISNNPDNGYVDGQEVFIAKHSSTGVFRFPKNGTGLRLAKDRLLSDVHDYIRLRYSRQQGRWDEMEYHAANSTDLTASATIAVPELVAGDIFEATVTATGAAWGDFWQVSPTSDPGGRTLSWRQTGADTVSVAVVNSTGATIAAGNLGIAARVSRG